MDQGAVLPSEASLGEIDCRMLSRVAMNRRYFKLSKKSKPNPPCLYPAVPVWDVPPLFRTKSQHLASHLGLAPNWQSLGAVWNWAPISEGVIIPAFSDLETRHAQNAQPGTRADLHPSLAELVTFIFVCGQESSSRLHKAPRSSLLPAINSTPHAPPRLQIPRYLNIQGSRAASPL